MWIFGCVLAASVAWFLMGGVTSAYYQAKVKKLELDGAGQEKQAELWREFARRVFHNHWFFTKGQAAWWFGEYWKRFDPKRKQVATAELQRDLLEARPALRNYIK